MNRPETPGLSRRLGLFDITMLVMGTVIGAGIFAVPHDVAKLVPSPALVLGAWILGGAIALAGSLVYAELTRRRPHVGGQYAFLREAYHPAVAFVYGWSLLLVVQTGGMATVAIIFARYFLELISLLGGSFALFAKAGWAGGVVTTVALGVLTLINCAGVRAAGTTQNIFMTLKILAILLVVFCGLLFAPAFTDVSPENGLAIPDLSESQQHSIASRTALLPGQLLIAFGAAMVPVFFAYGGWHTTTFMAAEVTNPERTLPRGLILGVSGVIALYVAVNYVCLRVLGVEGLALTEKPAASVMLLALGDAGAALISVGIAISALGFLSQATLTSPRVYYAMARDGLFFKPVAWIHPRTQVPVVAIVLQGVVAAVIALVGKFHEIVNYVMSVELLFWSLTALGLFMIRRRDAGIVDPASVSMPGHPVTTLVFVVVNLAVLVGLFAEYPFNSAMGWGIALAGVPVYLLWRGKPLRGAE